MVIQERLPALLVAWVAATAGSTALAHDFWIEPQSFRPAVQERVPIVLRVGEDFTGTSQPLTSANATQIRRDSAARPAIARSNAVHSTTIVVGFE